ncbi:MAG: endonuclease/exonuclease/phosphatase family protein [Salinivirgaceae bacterium]|nr:endonuclease/exonuclease/phosphatase family protein [Salinivirgaceae bacterium]
MKKGILLLLSFFTLTITAGFAQGIENLRYGTDTTFEITTWNIEHFPKNGNTTIDYVATIVENLDVDFLALQEIDDEASFNELVANLTDYSGLYRGYEYSGMAFLFKTDLVTVNNYTTILNGYSRELPRAPFVADITVRGQDYFIINNHYKCCGDGTLDENDDWDEEKRRYDASVLIKSYIDNYQADKNVILLGDLNDELLDNEADNVFQPFYDDPENYLFTDIEIAEGSSSDWSYPSWPSHLDHIMVTNELFSLFNDHYPNIQTIKPGDFMGGFQVYDNNVSDHRPIAMRLPLASDDNGISASLQKTSISVFPNPAQTVATIGCASISAGSVLSIYSSVGTLIEQRELQAGQLQIKLNIGEYQPGVYFIQISGVKTTGAQRLIINN